MIFDLFYHSLFVSSFAVYTLSDYFNTQFFSSNGRALSPIVASSG